jgi:PelA/Pel-15E family pectate lyase
MKTLILLTLLILPLHAKSAKDYLKRDLSWFASEEATRTLSNILSHQAETGGWPKNTDTTEKPYTGKREKIQATFDNGATTDELRFLSRRLLAKPDEKSTLRAFSNGLKHILDAQYPNGGWPQFHPPGKQYHRHITFNDGSMVRLLEFLRDIQNPETYPFLTEKHRAAAAKAFDLGIHCILKCQIRINGKPTVWCAQHDEKSLAPATARSYELPSLSGSESVGITRLLISLENPSPEVKTAIEGAIAWFQSAKIQNIRIQSSNNDKIVIPSPGAPPLWARFYDLKSNKPIFCDRDGIPKSSLAEIGRERRNGYSWYGNWPANLLEKEYPKWKKRH